MHRGSYLDYCVRYNHLVDCVDLVLVNEAINTYVLMPEDVDLFFFLVNRGHPNG